MLLKHTRTLNLWSCRSSQRNIYLFVWMVSRRNFRDNLWQSLLLYPFCSIVMRNLQVISNSYFDALKDSFQIRRTYENFLNEVISMFYYWSSIFVKLWFLKPYAGFIIKFADSSRCIYFHECTNMSQSCLAH